MSAVTFLRRAEREPPTDADRPALLFELGRAEILDRDSVARDHLATALSLSTDPVEGGRIALLLSGALYQSGTLALETAVSAATSPSDFQRALMVE